MSLSVIIPAYNRFSLLNQTLDNLLTACKNNEVEIIIIDDGSTPALETLIDKDKLDQLRLIKQENSGLITAKNTGLAASSKDYVLFLDSDDLIHPDKISLQLDKLKASRADVSYCNFAHTISSSLHEESRSNLSTITDPTRFYLQLRPPPHVPIFKSSYIKQHLLKSPIIKADRKYDAVGEVWIYYNLAPYEAKIEFCPEVLSYVYCHHDSRITDHWEYQSLAALELTEKFLDLLTENEVDKNIQRVLGISAFHTWRKLPKNCPYNLEKRWFQVWKQCPDIPETELGGQKFQMACKVLGINLAGKLFRFIQRGDYQAYSTLQN